ncbi:hypothetical protein FULANO1_77 [Escherichia phage vB_EcoD_Fulano1]|uniref:Uncharacterized protein n=1 Tax=Escherichia phage vB_EcoD_Fulano1 TaxID=2902670 RepID=A0AC61TRC9_9CAUD|nr:hypothetical protein FULANO1_77 [Escherichia phage vB_EcoD_Fulano1]
MKMRNFEKIVSKKKRYSYHEHQEMNQRYRNKRQRKGKHSGKHGENQYETRHYHP